MLKVQRETGIYLFSTNTIPNREIQEYYGIVTGSAIFGANFMKDYLAKLADTVGGRARGYEQALDGAMEQALMKMALVAKKIGANAIIGIDIDTGDINNKMLMASCYGTAIKFI